MGGGGGGGGGGRVGVDEISHTHETLPGRGQVSHELAGVVDRETQSADETKNGEGVSGQEDAVENGRVKDEDAVGGDDGRLPQTQREQSNTHGVDQA